MPNTGTLLRAATHGTRSRLEGSPHERDGGSELAEHELCADADDAKPRTLQLAISAPIRPGLARVNGVIDPNDELGARGEEISDEEPRDGHLAAKGHAELTSLSADQSAASDSVRQERCCRAKSSNRAADFEMSD